MAVKRLWKSVFKDQMKGLQIVFTADLKPVS